MALQIRKHLKIELTATDIFEHPIFEDLVNTVRQRSEATAETEILPTGEAPAPVLPLQAGIFAIQQTDPTSVAYNLPFVLKFKTVPELEAVQSAIQKIVERHSSLRTRFFVNGGQVFQVILPAPKVDVQVHLKSDGEETVFHSLICPFNLDDELPFRAALILENNRVAYLFIDIHHISCDATSASIIIDNIATLLGGGALPIANSLSSKDYAIWYNNHALPHVIKEDSKYWLPLAETLSKGDLLPKVSNAIVQARRRSLRRITAQASSDLCKAVDIACRKRGCTQFALLLGIFQATCFRLFKSRINIGVPIECRDHPAQEQMVGMFVNTTLVPC
jgi:hypothetical protein